jgi:putative endonuclease
LASECSRGSNRLLGAFGERAAATMLESRGYQIIDRNWRCRWGELDLVATKGDELAFVEVKTRRGSALGAPEESVTSAKHERIWRSVHEYLGQHDGIALPPDWRLILVAVELNARNLVKRVELIEDVGV